MYLILNNKVSDCFMVVSDFCLTEKLDTGDRIKLHYTHNQLNVGWDMYTCIHRQAPPHTHTVSSLMSKFVLSCITQSHNYDWWRRHTLIPTRRPGKFGCMYANLKSKKLILRFKFISSWYWLLRSLKVSTGRFRGKTGISVWM